MVRKRERWSGRTAFVMAAVGSAVGLGNVWRFPYIAFKHGGGAFFIPYFVALLTAGIPIMIVEFALGQRFQKGAPGALGSVNKRFSWVGWLALLVAFTIVFYYCIIMAVSWHYMVASPTVAWSKPVAIHTPNAETGEETVVPASRVVLYHPARNDAERLRLTALQATKPKSERLEILSMAEVAVRQKAEAARDEDARLHYVSFEDNVGRYLFRTALGGFDSYKQWAALSQHNVAVSLARRIRATEGFSDEHVKAPAAFVRSLRKDGRHGRLVKDVAYWQGVYGEGGFSAKLTAVTPKVIDGSVKTHNVLGKTARVNLPLVFWSLVTWIAIFFIIAFGVKAVGKVVLWTVPLPVLLLLIMLVRGITLPGAADGIRYYLTPNWAVLSDPAVWMGAYGQIFFSLSLGFGILIAYASYMPRGRDVTNNAFLTSFANCATSFLAGFVVFSVLGYLYYVRGGEQSGMGIDTVVKGGPTLVFVTYPVALAMFPAFWGKVVGVLFFLCLLLLGIDSAFSLVEAVLTGLTDSARKLNRKTATAILCIIGFLAGLPFATKAGLMWLDIVDNWMSNYGLVVVGLLECIAVGYFFKLEDLTEYINERSDIHLHWWFDLFIRVVTPGVLIYLLATQVAKDVAHVYEGYDAILPRAVSVAGWGYFGLLVLISFILTRNWSLVIWYVGTLVLFGLYRLALRESAPAVMAAVATTVLVGGFLQCLHLAIKRKDTWPNQDQEADEDSSAGGAEEI